MKWIWFLLFLAILGEIMDTMELADAAKKKRKKKITKKKKKAKAKAKKKPNGRSTTKRPYTGYSDPGIIFYSPSPPADRNPNIPYHNIDVNNDNVHNGTLPGGVTNFAAPPGAVPITVSTAVMGQNGFNKRTWFQRTRQRRFIDEDPLVLEYLGLVDSGRTKNFDVERSKRSTGLLKVARLKGQEDNETTLVDENNNMVKQEDLIELRRQQENQNKLKNNEEEIKDQLDRLRRSPEEHKGKMREFGFEEKLQITPNNAKNRRRRDVDNVGNKNLSAINNQWHETEDVVRHKSHTYNYRRSKRAAERRDKVEPKKNNRNKQREDVNDTQGNREEVRERLGQQSVNVMQRKRNKLSSNKDEIKEEINRPKRDVTAHVDKVKEKLETRRQKQQEKRKQKTEKQAAKRAERMESLNAKRNASAGGGPQTMPLPIDREATTQLESELVIMPSDIQHNIRPKRSIDAEVFKLQSLDTDDPLSEDEDCFSDESCDELDYSIGSDENPAGIDIAGQKSLKLGEIQSNGQRELLLPKEGIEILPSRPKRQTLDTKTPAGLEEKDLSMECTGEDCSSEECVGEDCTYEDSDSDEESEELIVAKRHVEDDGPVVLLVRDRREIGRSKKTGKQMDFVSGCGGHGDIDYYGDYDGTGNLGDYGSDDYSEERRRRRNRKKNPRNNRKGRRYRNNRRNKGRKNRRNRANRRLQSSTSSLDQTTKSPFGVAAATSSSGLPSYLPPDKAVTFSPVVGMNSEPSMNFVHPLNNRKVDQRETTSRTTKPPDRPRRDVQGFIYSLAGSFMEEEPPYLEDDSPTDLERQKRFDVVSPEPMERAPNTTNGTEFDQYLHISLTRVKRQVPSDERKFKPENKSDAGLFEPKSNNKPERQKRGIEAMPVMYSPVLMSAQKLSDEELAELWKNITMQEKSAIPADGLLFNMPLNSTPPVERPKRSPTPNAQESLGGFQIRMIPDDSQLLKTSKDNSGSFTWASNR